MDAQCEREFARPDSQDVGLEAAIIERVRNSSLVEYSGTDNVARLKSSTEAVNPIARRWDGRGALCWRRSLTGRTGGAGTRANAGMSSAICVTTTDTEGLRVPGPCQTAQG